MDILPKNKAGWLRTLTPLALIGLGVGAWLSWEPGAKVADGRHDLGTNGIWMSHGWLASDTWFMQNPKRMAQLAVYHNTPTVIATLQDMKNKGMSDLFFDAHPCLADGSLPDISHDSAETLSLMAANLHQRVWAWAGGSRGEQCFPEKKEWRQHFVASCKDLLAKCPRLAGVMVNIEPWAENDPHMLALLDELHAGLPKGKQVAVAACPPPTLFQPNPNNHWNEKYFKQVAQKSDLMVVMSYDTGLSNDKLFVHLMASWTQEALTWAGQTPVLLGVADYAQDPPQPWHNEKTETLSHALAGIHAGLSSFETLPKNYLGVAVFFHESMTPAKWAVWEKEFAAKRKQIAIQKIPTLDDLMHDGTLGQQAGPQAQVAPQTPKTPEPPPMLRRPAEKK